MTHRLVIHMYTSSARSLLCKGVHIGGQTANRHPPWRRTGSLVRGKTQQIAWLHFDSEKDSILNDNDFRISDALKW